MSTRLERLEPVEEHVEALLQPLCRPAMTSCDMPKVLVEVTSPSTEKYDRGEKLEHCKRIASLKEVVLVSHRERLIEVWRAALAGRITSSATSPSWRRLGARSRSLTCISTR